MPALGPVFRHEMLAAGRKVRYVWMRVVIVAGMLLLLVMLYQSVRGFREDELSIAAIARLTASFYTAFAWVTMGGVLAVTPVVAAGAIATERERRTIEYLFATDLSNSEIVLDKLLARLLTVGKLVLAALPVLAIFRLLGGVPGDLLLLQFALLTSTATMVASYALLVGVYCERARDAAPRALGGVFLFLISPALVAGIGQLVGLSSSWLAEQAKTWLFEPAVWLLSLLSPIAALVQGGGFLGNALGIDVDTWAVLKTCGAQLVLSAILLTLAVLVVRRVHLNAAATPGNAKKRKRSGASSTTSRTPYERYPLLWKEMFAASTPKRGTKVRRTVGAVVLMLLIAAPLVSTTVFGFLQPGTVSYQDYMGVATYMAVITGSLVALSMGIRAAGLVSHERERDTWLSILTTPQTAADFVLAKTIGNFHTYRWALLGTVLIPLSGVVYDPIALGAAGGFAVSLGLIAWAATSIGLAASIRVKSSLKGVGITIAALLGMSLLYPILAGMFFALAGAGEGALSLFVLPPVAPMQLAMPMVFSFMGVAEGEMVLAYVASLFFYCVVGAVAYASNVNSFDLACGRGTDSTPAAERRSHGPATPTAAVPQDGQV